MKKVDLPFAAPNARSNPVHLVTPEGFDALRKTLGRAGKNWVQAQGFEAKEGSLCILPGEDGNPEAALFGVSAQTNPLQAGKLAHALPQGNWHFEGESAQMDIAALGFALGSYRFSRYRKQAAAGARLKLAKGQPADEIYRAAKAVFLVRDLINTPTNDMGPAELEEAFRKLAAAYKAKVKVIKGNDLLKENLPMIHAVGRASSQAPRLLDLKWGKASHPKVTLVGKGVCFDTGGLNIKPGNSMALMKKDMGGAANVMGLAMMVMDANLPVRLRVLIPAVENAIAGNSFRPGDVLPSRKGITVEIGNTDAEGRLVLGDALALGDEEQPDLMIDMATLTGAARVALGPDLPPFFTDDDALAEAIEKNTGALRDPLWRMPLWAPYETMLASKVADTNHITSGGFAGAVTAALFLKKFVNPETTWAHFDVFGWVPTAKPWAPVGGEAQGIRALFATISQRYS